MHLLHAVYNEGDIYKLKVGIRPCECVRRREARGGVIGIQLYKGGRGGVGI